MANEKITWRVVADDFKAHYPKWKLLYFRPQSFLQIMVIAEKYGEYRKMIYDYNTKLITFVDQK